MTKRYQHERDGLKKVCVHCSDGYENDETECPVLLRIALDRAEEEVERAQVQLAGCSVAALGGTSPEVVARPEQWGWSLAYADVLLLRRRFDAVDDALDGARLPGLSDGTVPEEWSETYRRVCRLHDAVTTVLALPDGVAYKDEVRAWMLAALEGR